VTLKGFSRFLLAYLASTLAVLGLAAAVLEIVRFWVDLTFGQLVLPLWALTVGQMGLRWSLEKLGRSLSVRPVPEIKVRSWRSISLFGSSVLADRVRSVVASTNQVVRAADTLDIPDELTFICGSFVFTEADVLVVLRRSWQRQLAGKHPLSRDYWLGRGPFHGDREKYDAVMDVLEASGLIVGRKPGACGRLVAPPLACISLLKHSIKPG